MAHKMTTGKLFLEIYGISAMPQGAKMTVAERIFAIYGIPKNIRNLHYVEGTINNCISAIGMIHLLKESGKL